MTLFLMLPHVMSLFFCNLKHSLGWKALTQISELDLRRMILFFSFAFDALYLISISEQEILVIICH